MATAKKKTAKKKAPASKRKAALKTTRELTGPAVTTLFRKIDALLKQGGFDAKVNELQVLPSLVSSKVQPRVAVATTVSDCPPPKRWRRVCFRDENGNIVCQDRCV